MKTRKSTAIAAALGGVAAVGAGADPADAMLPAPDGGGAPPSTNTPDQPVRTGHPTQGQTQASAPSPPPPRKPTPPPVRSGHPTQGQVDGPPTPPATPASDPVQRNQPVRRPTPPPVRTGHPTQGQEVQARQHDRRTQNPGPAPEQQNDLHESAERYARALDQIEANGGALNQGTANTLNEFRDKPRVRRLAKQIENADEQVEEGTTAVDPQPGRFGLRREDTGSHIDDLKDRYPAATVDDVLADGNRHTRDLPDDNDALDGVPDPEGYQWNEGDEDTDHFHPQGITGDDEKNMDVVSWHGQPGGDGPSDRGRVSFVDRDKGTYRHVLLVDAKEDGEFDQVETHAGGITMRGPLMYVAETNDGLSVYDTRDIVRVDDDEQDADGYKYLLPRGARYTNVGAQMRFSSISMDESDPENPAMVVSEYVERGKAGEPDSTRVVRWNLGPDGLPEENASAAYETGKDQVQGATMHGGRLFMSSSNPAGTTGELYSGRPGSALSVTYPWSDGVESLYVRDGRLWTVTEHEGKRVVHGSPLSEY